MQALDKAEKSRRHEGLDDDRLVSRRHVLGGSALSLAVASVGSSSSTLAAPISPELGRVAFGSHLVRFADLTHRLTKQFNVGLSTPRLAMESVDGSGVRAGMRMHRLALIEHTGTHIDAPSHFDENGKSLGEIPISDLIVPLAVIDISPRAREDPNAQLQVEDVEHWERRHGRLPGGCCVAMHSGWQLPASVERPPGTRFASTGFSLEAARMLVEARSVKGIAVDAMTLDNGLNVPSYPVHQYWLRTGRWGIEGMANLTAIPPSGSLLIVGAAPISEATGVPVRAVALF